MKLPRWLVVSLLSMSALAVLGAGAWWWVTWPERTAREFLSHARDGNWMEVLRIDEVRHCDLLQRASMGSYDEYYKHFFALRDVEPNGRNGSDFCLSRQSFRLVHHRDGDTRGDLFVERGRVTLTVW